MVGLHVYWRRKNNERLLRIEEFLSLELEKAYYPRVWPGDIVKPQEICFPTVILEFGKTFCGRLS